MNYQKILKQNNLRVTSARTLILEILSTSAQPVDISYLHQQIKETKTSCDQATIYRTLEQLVKADIVKQIDFREGKYRYEIKGDHHHHLVCQKCGTIVPVYDQCLALTEETIAQKYQFLVSEHHLEFFGLCSSCN